MEGFFIIKVLILYYLSIKATHGYEIQKFIQMNQLDKWTKIQSGSIYYALNKLEKEKLIRLRDQEIKGEKARKIYEITDNGRSKLDYLVKLELDNEIADITSDKFVIYPILNVLDKNTMIEHIKIHIVKLEKKLEYLFGWKKIKVTDNTLKVEKIAFEIMIQNLENQIKWHEALIEEMDKCMLVSKDVEQLIRNFDFSNISKLEESRNNYIENLKKEILNDPQNAEKKLDELINNLIK